MQRYNLNELPLRSPSDQSFFTALTPIELRELNLLPVMTQEQDTDVEAGYRRMIEDEIFAIVREALEWRIKSTDDLKVRCRTVVMNRAMIARIKMKEICFSSLKKSVSEVLEDYERYYWSNYLKCLLLVKLQLAARACYLHRLEMNRLTE